MNLSYSFPSAQNAGRIGTMNDGVTGDQVTYTYDSLNRLIKAETTQNTTQYPNAPRWGQSFTYDGFGNLTAKTPTAAGPSTTMSLTVNPANNQITTSGFSYDLNGNMTGFPNGGGTTSIYYDIENRSGGGTWYDLNNQPLTRAGSSGAIYMYGLNGERLSTWTFQFGYSQVGYDAGTNTYIYQPNAVPTEQTRNIYFAGRLIRSNDKTVVLDRQGSVRANESGEKIEYFPYGEEITVTNPQDREKFGTYTRESATGLDYADQRYYASTYGRFASADPDHTSATAPSDPKSGGTWNRYVYAAGDPINNVDPTGNNPCSIGTLALNFDDITDKDVALGCGASRNPVGYLDGCTPYVLALEGSASDCIFAGGVMLPEQQHVTPPPPSCEDREVAYLMTYLGRYASPLISFADEIVVDSDMYDLDDRFIVALAGVESRYGTTQRTATWGAYNAFSNAAHCVSLSNPHCYKVNPYTDYWDAVTDVTSLIGASPLYSGMNSTAAIYALYETGNASTPSKATPILNKIYGNQLHGDIGNVRVARCPLGGN